MFEVFFSRLLRDAGYLTDRGARRPGGWAGDMVEDLCHILLHRLDVFADGREESRMGDSDSYINSME